MPSVKLRSVTRPFTSLLLALCIVTAACDDPARPLVPGRLTIESGDEQDGVVGAMLPQQLRVRVTTEHGRPVRNVEVTWQGDGVITPVASVTDAEGFAEARWKLGTVAGRQLVTASLGSVGEVEFSADAVAGSPAAITVGPRLLMLATGEARQLTAEATDEYGNAIAADNILWAATDETVARIDNPPQVTGIGSGSTRVIARAGAVADTVYVKVDRTAWVAIATGDDTSCGIALGGQLYCWGWNGGGEVGDGTRDMRTEPVAVGGPLRFAQVTTSYQQACAISTEGDAYCWGHNSMGEAGDGTTTMRLVPTAVIGGHKFNSISAGIAHTCAKTLLGEPYCWGLGSSGQLGNGAQESSSFPVRVSGATVTTIDVGSSFATALVEGGAAQSWGDNWLERLATVDAQSGVLRPSPVRGTLRFRAISAGAAHTCAIATDAEAYCWGDNTFGAAGDAVYGTRTHPVRINTFLRFETIHAGLYYTCGLTATGDPYCWGLNDFGQLGIEPASAVPVPTLVRTGERFIQLAVNLNGKNTCGVTVAGDAWCWGYNSTGQLGNGTTTNSSVPVKVNEPR